MGMLTLGDPPLAPIRGPCFNISLTPGLRPSRSGHANIEPPLSRTAILMSQRCEECLASSYFAADVDEQHPLKAGGNRRAVQIEESWRHVQIRAGSPGGVVDAFGSQRCTAVEPLRVRS